MSQASDRAAKNPGRVLQRLFAEGPTTRAALARGLGVTRAALTDLANRLIEAGLLREDAGERRAGLGRPGQLLRLRSDAAHFVGVEIGVERLVAVAVDLDGALIGRAEEHGELVGVAPPQVFKRVARLVGKLRRSARLRGADGGVGVSVPGFMTRGGVVLSTPLLGWRNIDVVSGLRPHFERPVMAENDANATAHGEWHFAHEPRGGDLLAVVLASGVGCGFVSDGRILRGAHGLAGELGHLPMAFGDGREEAWETRAGLDALRRSGNAEEWALWVARGLAAAVYAYDPHTIVIAGELADVFAGRREEVAAHLRRLLVAGFPEPALKVARFGGDGCAIGAASLPHARFLQRAEID